MASGVQVCRIVDEDVDLRRVYYARTGFLPPEGYIVDTVCGAKRCVVHLRLVRASHRQERFTAISRDTLPVYERAGPGKVHPLLGVYSNDRRLKIAQAWARSGRGFASTAQTWEEYTEDYLTSPRTTVTQKRAFCRKHLVLRGLACRCGLGHSANAGRPRTVIPRAADSPVVYRVPPSLEIVGFCKYETPMWLPPKTQHAETTTTDTSTNTAAETDPDPLGIWDVYHQECGHGPPLEIDWQACRQNKVGSGHQ